MLLLIPLLNFVTVNFLMISRIIDLCWKYIHLYLYIMRRFWQLEPFISLLFCLLLFLVNGRKFFHLKWLTFSQIRIFIGSFFYTYKKAHLYMFCCLASCNISSHFFSPFHSFSSVLYGKVWSLWEVKNTQKRIDLYMCVYL